MGNKKKSSETERKVHKISFKKEPIWLKMNIIGRYEGIKYRFTYKEYCSDDVDDVISAYQFAWPGRIPDDKELAEKGIQAMFKKQLDAGDISYKVIKDDIDTTTSEAEEKALYEIINEDIDFSGDEDII